MIGITPSLIPRRRRGLRPVQVDVGEQEIDFLQARRYELTRTDDRSIGRAVSALLSDSAFEEAYAEEATDKLSYAACVQGLKTAVD
jgi:hypothetical protein